MSRQMQAEIAQINGAIDHLDDPRDSYMVVVERIREYRRSGTAVPEELAQMERRLMRECIAASQGR